MTKGTVKKSRTPHERFQLKLDKIISTLIQMKPIADNAEKKEFVYGFLKQTLEYAEKLVKE